MTVADPIAYGNLKGSTVIFQASLASRPETDDAIDIAVVRHLTEKQAEKLKRHEILYFHPFDPVGKQTFAKVRDPKGMVFHTAKGAPQVILAQSLNKDDIGQQVEKDVDEYATFLDCKRPNRIKFGRKRLPCPWSRCKR